MVPEVDVDVFGQLLHPDRPVIDVREPHEYVAGHVPGAINYPLSSLHIRINEIDTEELFVICESGGRSATAADLLRATGLRAVSVSGGTSAWKERGRPLVTGSSPH